jgi:hypothetical protein
MHSSVCYAMIQYTDVNIFDSMFIRGIGITCKGASFVMFSYQKPSSWPSHKVAVIIQL